MNQFRDLDVERRILTAGAVAFLNDLEEEFGWRRGRLLSRRREQQRDIDAGRRPDFLEETAGIRSADWTVVPPPADLTDRRVEITGPVDARMMINALNSGADVFMADFEDATSPTWSNLLEGQANLVDAYRRTLRAETPARSYSIGDDPATLVVRPRGWHLDERHFLVHGQPMSASLFDFGLYLFHGARSALDAGTGPYLYLPKLESHLEARLWNDVFVWAQDRLGIPRGTVRATVLIENVLAAFEMDEILYELGEHAVGLNAGRWDYIFSMIRTFRDDPGFVLPDRSDVTMTVPFMEAYARLMVSTCHRRGAHAIGGMSAFIPNGRDPKVNQDALTAVGADKAREAAAGFDGTWVAHPGLVEVARHEFDLVLGGSPNQIDRLGPEATVSAHDLLDLDFEGAITDRGVASNVSIAIRYLAAWLSGTGAVAIDDLMEDVATAEISRSQIWQWVRHHAVTAEGHPITETLIRELSSSVAADLDDDAFAYADQVGAARKIFEEVALGEPFIDFLTLPAYAHLD